MQCNRTISLDAFFSHILYDETRIALLGSGCSVATEAEAEISHYYNLTQVNMNVPSTLLYTTYTVMIKAIILYLLHDKILLDYCSTLCIQLRMLR